MLLLLLLLLLLLVKGGCRCGKVISSGVWQGYRAVITPFQRSSTRTTIVTGMSVVRAGGRGGREVGAGRTRFIATFQLLLLMLTVMLLLMLVMLLLLLLVMKHVVRCRSGLWGIMFLQW